MVHKFTEEQKDRFMEGIRKHEERFHNGERTMCNSYSACWAIERKEWAEQDARSSS